MAVITYETVTVKTEGVSVDGIIWQRFTRPMPGLLEEVLALPENQHLEHCRFELPIGTVVTIPIHAQPEAEPAPMVTLWS